MQATTQRADPETAALILVNGPDPIAAQALGVGRVMAVGGKGAARRIEAIETAAARGDIYPGALQKAMLRLKPMQQGFVPV
jgi:hypothetical protein